MAVMSEPTVDLRVRREINDLSGLDLARLRRAFAATMAVDDLGGYRYWAEIHAEQAPHHTPAFLLWNRVYLEQFEQALRAHEPGVTLPWWDWNSDPGIPKAFSEPAVNDAANPLFGFRIDRPVQESRKHGWPLETTREPRSPTELPPRYLIEDVLREGAFEEFAQRLEAVHDSIHLWVGGTNAEMSYAAFDPFFWVYQASIDRLWWLWQRRHPDAAPIGNLGERGLAPFEASVSGKALEAERLGYSYSDAQPESRSILLSGAISDRPSVADELNFSDYAQAFGEIISAADTEPPLTIGIYGSWGIGKSSLLEMIADQFKNPDAGSTAVHVVAFNAWEYNSSEKIWPSLVRRVMEEMERRALWGKRARLWDTLRRNAGREWRRRRLPLGVGLLSVLVFAVLAAFALDFDPKLIVAGLAALGISGAAKVISDAATNPVSKWVTTLVEREGYGEELPYMREIRADLHFLAEQMRRNGAKPRILVTIDDLDRCEPEKAVEVLQAVNQLLDFDAFVICLGIDARIITAAVEAHYQQLLGEAGASGYEYLDKIVQIPFRIPTPSPAEIQSFLSAQMPVKSWPAGNDAAPADLPSKTADEEDGYEGKDGLKGLSYRVTSDETIEPVDREGRPVRPTMFEQSEVHGFRDLAPYIRSNPRHIKRLINVYRMVRTLALRRGVDEILDDRNSTISWIVICAQWPYAVSGMLRSLKPHIEAVDDGGAYPDGEPLVVLHSECVQGLDEDLRRKLDGDPEQLSKLLNRTKLGWEQLRVLQAYTLNFNPAIEEVLQRTTKVST